MAKLWARPLAEVVIDQSTNLLTVDEIDTLLIYKYKIGNYKTKTTKLLVEM